MTMGNLGVTLGWLGKHAEAEPMQREVLEAQHELHQDEPRHPATLTAMNNLAGTLGWLDKHAEAEPMLREVLAAQRELHQDDPRHPATLAAMNNLVCTLGELGRHAEAQGELAAAGLPLRETLAAPRATSSVTKTKQKRNALCQCGSGTKFKMCCGKVA